MKNEIFQIFNTDLPLICLGSLAPFYSDWILRYKSLGAASNSREKLSETVAKGKGNITCGSTLSFYVAVLSGAKKSITMQVKC